MENEQTEGFERMVLAVSYNVTDDTYTVGTCQGSSVEEMAFAVMVVIKTLERDGHIESPNTFLDLVDKYLNDPQFEEVTEDGTDNS